MPNRGTKVFTVASTRTGGQAVVSSRRGEGAHCYQGRRGVLATKHDKAPLVAPVLHASVGLIVEGISVDTDVLGTFSGDVARPGGPWETAVAKARLGMSAADCLIGLASEGSIGPDASAPFVICAVELVVLVDDERGIVVAEAERGFDIATVAGDVAPGDHLDDLLRQGRFPEHAMIVRPASGLGKPIFKGIVTVRELERAIRSCASASGDGRARVETDLRAHRCPSRRPIIARAAQRLAARLASCCSDCGSPGWGLVRVELGVPCSWCGGNVQVPRADVMACPLCPATRTVSRAQRTADPRNCEWCNP